MDDEQEHWQPVLLIGRAPLRCDCGAVAIILMLDDDEKGTHDEQDFGYSAWCQACYDRDEG